MGVKAANNVSARLAAGITASQTTLTAKNIAGAFPALAAGDWFPLTVFTLTGDMEIMRCTGVDGATLTVARGQDGTTAQAFPVDALIELRPTAAVVEHLQAEADGKLPLPVALGGGVDLNTLQSVGLYSQNMNVNATSGANYPANVAGTLIVQNAGSQITTQIYIVYNTGVMWVRGRYNATWSAWRQLAATTDKVANAGHADTADAAVDQTARDAAANAANIANSKAPNSRLTVSYVAPSGGVDGDLWFQP